MLLGAAIMLMFKTDLILCSKQTGMHVWNFMFALETDLKCSKIAGIKLWSNILE